MTQTCIVRSVACSKVRFFTWATAQGWRARRSVGDQSFPCRQTCLAVWWCPVLCCLALFWCVVFGQDLPFLVLSGFVLSCLVLPCLVLSSFALF